LIKPACHLLTNLLIYLLTKQNITNLFTYSSQHNQNTNENHRFFTILSPQYLFIQFVIYSYIQSENNIGAQGAKDLGTGIAQCKNITTLTLDLYYQLIKPASHLLTNLLIYLLTKQNITNFFTYSSQNNQNTNESHRFFTILSPPYLFIQFVIYSYIQSDNNIGDEGAKDLGTGIAQCKNITTLTLDL
ncbi:kinase domain protein, partial (macronuclear) [Tetrahymena thermophila SB210]